MDSEQRRASLAGFIDDIDLNAPHREQQVGDGGTGDSSDDIEVSNHWAAITLASFSIVTVTINLILLVLFTKRRSLRTVSNRFVINLLFISLTSSIVLVPFVVLDLELQSSQNVSIYASSTSAIDFSWPILNINGVYLLVAQFTLNFICTASILSILLIGVDQYLAVLHPLRCHSYMNKPKSFLLILLSYTLSLTSASLMTVLNGDACFFANLSAQQTTCVSLWMSVYAVGYLSLIIAVPFLTICTIYVLIYRAAHRSSARLRRNHNAFDNTARSRVVLPKVQSAPSFIAGEQLASVMSRDVCADLTTIERTHSDRIPNIITSLKTKISNASASAFRYREENRTAKISILVIVMVLACYAPYGVMQLLNAMHCDAPRYMLANKIAVFSLLSSNMWSPILFALRNRRVQRELRKAFIARGAINRRHSRPQIIIQHIEPTLNKNACDECVVQVEPFLPQDADAVALHDEPNTQDTKSILKRVCSKNWAGYKKCSFINVPDGCLDARGSFSSASTQISTEE